MFYTRKYDQIFENSRRGEDILSYTERVKYTELCKCIELSIQNMMSVSKCFHCDFTAGNLN